VWYHTDLAPLGIDSLGLITSRGMEFKSPSRPEAPFFFGYMERTAPRTKLPARQRCAIQDHPAANSDPAEQLREWRGTSRGR
jgi:hypothetical protein